METQTITLEDPSRSGYTFDSWFTDAGFTLPITEIAAGSTANIELFAKWNTETYSITYNLDGGTGNSNPSTYDVETATITLTSVTKSNYEFGGWFSDAGFTSPISEITIGSSGNVEVYAYWTPTQYTITYNLNGGSNNVGNPTTYTVETHTITLEDPSRSGYTFDGWFTDAGLTTSISEIPLGTAGDVTVYAAWDIIPVYDISVLGGFSSYITPLLDANSLNYTTDSEYVAGSNVYIVTSGTSDTVFQTLLDNNCNIMIDAYFADNSALFETLYGATNYSMDRYNSVITDNTHYITTGYSGTIEFSSSGGRIVTVAPGAFTELMNYSGQPSLGYIDGSGKIVYGGVFFIYNEDFPDYASTEAKEIFIRSLDWLAQ